MAVNHVFTKWSILSTDLFYQQVNDAFGRVVVDQAGFLDPILAAKQINAAVGTDVFYANGPLDRGITDPHWSPDELAADMGLETSS